MRKISFWGLIILSCLCIALGLGCSCGDDGPRSSTIHLSEKTVSLTVGEKKLLTTKCDIENGLEIVYESSNNSVATVNDKGLVTAVGIGQAEVTVSRGQDSDSCKVNVSLNGQEPMLKIPAVEGDRVQIAKNTFLDLSTVIVFNGLSFQDAEVTYTVGDTSVGTVTDGIFTPIKVGETQIIVKAKWQGVEDVSTTKTITVKVIENIEIALNNGLDGELVLFSLDDTEQTFSITCKESGVAAVPSYSITHGAEYVKFSGNTLQSNGRAGYSELTVTFTGASGNVYEKIIPIYVKHTVITLDKLDNFSALDGDIIGGKTLGNLLGEQIESATYGKGNPLNVEDDKVYGLPTDGKEIMQTTLTVYGSTHAIQAEVNAYTKVIDEAEDFKIFYVGNETWDDIKNHDTFDGYYVLANSIDASDYVHQKVGEGYVSGNAAMQSGYDYLSGLTGTFDGKGFTVTGMTLSSYGLFGHINGATIKNVAFTDVRFNASPYLCLFGAYLINSTVSNVYIQVNDYGTSNQGNSTAWITSYNSTVENMLIEIPVECNPNDNQKKQGYGSLQHMWAEKTTANWLPTFWRNVYVISPTVLNYLGRSNYSVDAENREGDVTLPQGVKAYYQTGILRYDSYDDMKKAGLSFTSMPADYWKNVDGALVWKDELSLETDVDSLDAVIENFSAYDGDINLKTAFNANAGDEIVLESAYQGTQRLNVDGNKILGIKPKFIKVGGKIKSVDLVPVTINGKVNGESKSVCVGIRAYTRIIDEPSDMLMFKDDTATKSGTMPINGKSFDGYYILSKNLDMTVSDVNATYFTGPFKGSYLNGRGMAKNFDQTIGLTGVFDGNGYSIKNMKAPINGLFGVVNGGTVKNVAFIDVDIQQGCGFAIAAQLKNAEIENVYISTSKLKDNNASFPTAPGWLDSYNSTISNVLIEVKSSTEYKYSSSSSTSNKNGYGSLSAQSGECSTAVTGWTGNFVNVYKNVYVISKDKLCTSLKNGDIYTLDGENCAEATKNLVGVRRYESEAALKAANLDFAGMNKEFWQVEGGLITWKGRSNPPVDLSSVDTVINMFSAYDGDIDLTEAFGAQKTQTVVLLSATQDDVPLTVSDGKILGVKPVYVLTKGKITGVDYAVVKLTGTVDGTEVTTVVAIKAYTRVIDEASDMLMFKDDIATNSNDLPIKGKPFDGYYILSKNLDMTASDVNAAYFTSFTGNLDGRNQAKNIEETVGLTGVFDGNGYSIKNMKAPKSGLFGVVNGGTVKNVAFVDVNIENSYSAAIAAHLKNAVIENVYISTAKLREKTKNCQTAPGWFDSYNSTISNVLIEVKSSTEYIYSSSSTTPNTKGYGSLSAFSGECFAKWTEVNVYKNVYVIAKDKLSDDGRGTTLDGENCAKATKNLVGVRRYESEAAMKADTENDYTPFGSLWGVNDNRLTWKGKA